MWKKGEKVSEELKGETPGSLESDDEDVSTRERRQDVNILDMTIKIFTEAASPNKQKFCLSEAAHGGHIWYKVTLYPPWHISPKES